MSRLPAAGLRVLDLSMGMSGALVVRMLADAGAHIDRLPPESGDPFYDVYPAYAAWKSVASPQPLTALQTLLDQADICLTGGEDFPGLSYRFDPEDLRRNRPRLIVVDIKTLHGDPAMDLLVQARMGLVNEQFSTHPVYIAAATPTYGVVFSAQIGLWAALIERERSGLGQVVTTSYEQGAALLWSQIWMEAHPQSPEFDKLPPRDVLHLIFQCADGEWIQFVLGVPKALAKVYAVLNIDIPVDPEDRGLPSLERPAESYFADRGPLQAAIRQWSRDELVRALWAAGIAAEPALMPGEAWNDPQVQHCQLIRTLPDGTTLSGSPLVVRHIDGTAAPLLPEAADDRPLSGLKVVDLGNFIAGPFASKLLADLGADVIKVEPPTGLGNLTGLRNTWSCNRGKRSIVLDLKVPEDYATVQSLCAGADIVHHNFRVGVAARLGLDPSSLRRLNPHIITLQTSGYGQTGPKAEQPGWDMVMQALCGLERRAGGEGNPPLWYRSAVVDYSTGALGAISLLMAVFSRARCGGSVETEVSLLSTALTLMSELIRTPEGDFMGTPLLNSARTGYHPCEQIYAARDGWIAIAARSEACVRNLSKCLNLGIDRPRQAWGLAESAAISRRLSGMTMSEAGQVLTAAGIWSQACASDAWPALRDDSEARRRSLVIDVADSRFGNITGCFGPAVSFSRSKTKLGEFRSAPLPDEHAAEIRQALASR